MSGTFKQRTTCQHCGRLTSTEDDLGKWFRAHCGKQLSVQDVDYIFHRFWGPTEDGLGTREVQHVMIIETKTRSADIDDAQRDTLIAIDTALRTFPRRCKREGGGQFASGHTAQPMPMKGLYGNRNVIFYGVHKLRMDGTHPDNSAWLTWDDKELSREKLLLVLRFELHPDSLKPMPKPRRRKKSRPIEPTLFDQRS